MTEQERPRIPIQKVPGEEAARSFFRGEERILRDIVRGTQFSFKRGEGWAINPETGEGTYDPRFFTEKGYHESQALFASLHEIDHVTELAELLETGKGRKIWENLKRKKQKQERTHLLHNCVTFDLADNKRVLQIAPSMSEDMTALYREKLFPVKDFRDQPMHLQMLNAILRKSMLPDESVAVEQKYL